MREIQTAENKTLKLTNVVSRRIQPEEFNNMQIVLTQMHNFIKSNVTSIVTGKFQLIEDSSFCLGCIGLV